MYTGTTERAAAPDVERLTRALQAIRDACEPVPGCFGEARGTLRECFTIAARALAGQGHGNVAP